MPGFQINQLAKKRINNSVKVEKINLFLTTVLTNTFDDHKNKT